MHCTVPAWMKPWFDRHFSEHCHKHDVHYVKRDLPKFVADFIVAVDIGKTYWWSFPIGFVTFPILLVHPKAYILWYRDEQGKWRW